MKKLFDTLDSKFREKFKLQKLGDIKEAQEYYGTREIEEFYTYNRSSWPGLNYLVSDPIKKRILIFRIEIDYRIFCGFKLLQQDKENQCFNSIPYKISRSYISDKQANLLNCSSKEADWNIWAFLPDNSEDNSPNFKVPNQALLDLATDKNFNKFVDQSIEFIGNFSDLFEKLKNYDF